MNLPQFIIYMVCYCVLPHTMSVLKIQSFLLQQLADKGHKVSKDKKQFSQQKVKYYHKTVHKSVLRFCSKPSE